MRGLVWGTGMCRRRNDLNLGPSAGLVAPGTKGRVSAPDSLKIPVLNMLSKEHSGNICVHVPWPGLLVRTA